MIGGARITLLTCVVGLLAGVLISTVGAQTEGSSAQTQTAAPPTETWGAPPELQAVAAEVDRLLRERRFAEARALCQAGYDSATDDSTRALALRGIGETYQLQHVLDRAIEVFEQVIARYPQSDQVAWAKVGIAESYVLQAEDGWQERVAKAMTVLEPLLQDPPNEEWVAAALRARGRCYELLGNNEAALAAYLKVVDLFPKLRRTRHSLERAIELQQKLGRWGDAIATAKRYIELLPQQDPTQAAELLPDAWFTIGLIYANTGNVPQAIVEFDKALAYCGADDMKRGETIYRIAAELVGVRQYEAAHHYLGVVLASASPSFGFWREACQYMEGQAYYQAGDYDAALSVFRDLLATSTREADKKVARAIIADIEGRSEDK